MGTVEMDKFPKAISKKFSRRNKLVIIATVILLETVSSSLTSSINNSKPANHSSDLIGPQIILYAYERQANHSDIIRPKPVFDSKKDRQNEFISKTGNDYIVSNKTQLVVLICESDYPITWMFPCPNQITSPLADGNLTPLDYRDSDFSLNSTEPVATRFRLFMTINLSPVKFLSLNVTCVSTEKQPEIQSTIHISLENSTNSDPGTPANDSFEPKSIFNGTAGLAFAPSKPNLDFHLHAGPQVTCCSGVKGKSPKMYMKPCHTPLNCQIAKKVMMEEVGADMGYTNYDSLLQFFGSGSNKTDGDNSTDCRKKVLVGSSTLVVCKGETVNYAEQFVNVFHSSVNGPVESRAKDNRERDTTGQDVRSLSKYEAASLAQSRNISQRMAIMIGYSIPKDKRGQVATSNPFPMHFIQVDDPLLKATENSFGPQDFRSEIREMPYVETVKEYNRDFYYEGESLSIMCFGITFFHSSGAHLRLNWKNGTRSFLEKWKYDRWGELRTTLYLSGNASMFDGWGGEMVPVFRVPVVASLEMSSIDCWMPVSNSGRWDKMSRSLEIRPGVAPRFAENRKETVTFNLGDEGKVIVCTIKDAVPSPRLSVSKDFKIQPTKFVEAAKNKTRSNNGTSVIVSMNEEHKWMVININFWNVTKDDQGMWRCIAKNVKARAFRSIKVVVKDPTS